MSICLGCDLLSTGVILGPDPDELVRALQNDDGLERELNSAHKAMVGVMEDGRMRSKGSENDKVSMRLGEARELSVKTYQRAGV